MNARLLPLRSVPELARRRRDPVSKQALAEAAPIVDAVRTGGEAALREYAERFGDVWPGGGAGAGAAAPLFHDRAALNKALARLPTDDRTRLERVAERIRGFAEAQYRALCPVAVSVPGWGRGRTSDCARGACRLLRTWRPVPPAFFGPHDGRHRARGGRPRRMGGEP